MFAKLIGRLQTHRGRKTAWCSFCSRKWEKDRPLAEGCGPDGTGGVYICQDCVGACGKLIDGELIRLAKVGTISAPTEESVG